MSPAKKLHIAWGVCAFISAISFFNIEAAFFDDRGLNWVPLVSGIVFFLLGAYFLYKVIKKAGSSRF
jgi:hypothetical protein